MRIVKFHGLEPHNGHPLPLRVMRMCPQTPLKLHAHDFDELVVILSGQGVHFSENREHAIEAGHVFIIGQDDMHGYRDTQDMTLVNILYRPDQLGLPLAELRRLAGYHALFTLEPRLRHAGTPPARMKLDAADLATANRLIDQLEQELQERELGFRFLGVAHLMQLIGFLVRCNSVQHEESDELVARLAGVLSFIEANYDQPLTLDDLTQVAHMSASSLLRAFRQCLGRPPIDYVIRLRVEKACELLRQPMSVTETAFRVGFSDSSYFTRQFRRITGLTPREYATQR